MYLASKANKGMGILRKFKYILPIDMFKYMLRVICQTPDAIWRASIYE